MESKLSISADELCAGYPYEFLQFLTYAKNLPFEERPDYGYLKRMFNELLIREGEVYDNVYDWISLNPIRSGHRKSSSKPEELEKVEEVPGKEESKEIKELEVKIDI